MSAEVIAYSAHPDDDLLALKVECTACGIEWGWGPDVPAVNERLGRMADIHDIRVHGAVAFDPRHEAWLIVRELRAEGSESDDAE